MAKDDAVRITTAATSPQADISARQRRYVISMSIRTVCFVGAILVGPGWLRWVLVAAAVLLPYVAVVMANAATSRTDAFELRTGDYRTELPAGRERPDDAGPAGRPDRPEQPGRPEQPDRGHG